MRIVEVQYQVAKHFGLSVKELQSPSRYRRVARPRQIGMYLCRELTGKSYPLIGEAFCRDHTTVMHAVQHIGALIATNEEVAALVEGARRSINGG